MGDVTRTAGQAMTFPYYLKDTQGNLLTPATNPVLTYHPTAVDAAAGTNQLAAPQTISGAAGAYVCTYPTSLAAGTYFTKFVSSVLPNDADDRLILQTATGSVDAGLLVSAAELESYLEMDTGSLDTARAGLFLAGGQAIVEGLVRQQLLQTTSTHLLPGTPESWLDLPQRPVSAVLAVAIDGIPLSDWVKRGNRLWRPGGWERLSAYEMRTITQEWMTGKYVRQPSEVSVTYTHGYQVGDSQLDLARQVVLMLAATALDNPTGEKSAKIDDYQSTLDTDLASMQVPAMLQATLRGRYARGAGSVRPQ